MDDMLNTPVRRSAWLWDGLVGRLRRTMGHAIVDRPHPVRKRIMRHTHGGWTVLAFTIALLLVLYYMLWR